MASTSSAPNSLKEYLKKYTSNANEEQKKKKKKRKVKPDNSGVLVVDEDPIWQKPVKLEEEEDSADEEKPQVDEDIEVKRMKRLEQLKSKRPYGAISEDGSGWVSLSNTPDNMKSENQDFDIFPLRSKRRRNDTPSPEPEEQPTIPKNADLSPPRKQTKILSSPGSRKARYDTPSPEPSGSERRVVSDLSPPRRQQREKHTTFLEPGRRSSYSRSKDSDTSPRRAYRDPEYRDNGRASSIADLSPPRKVEDDRSNTNLTSRKSTPSISDLSPPRRRKGSPLVVNRPKTGLVSGEDIKEEIDRIKKEDLLRFRKMDPSVSGRDAEAVYRNKITGEQMSKEEFLNSQKKEKKKEEKPKEIKLEWGKGLAQKREAEARQQEIEAEKDMPFARTRDDPDLDRMLKDRLRWGDPMAHLVKKKNSNLILPDLGESDRMKESGFIVPQEIPNHSWLKRGFDAAPNRYGIKPGRHWDGVDRSNGTEKEFFKRTNEKSATEREAYLWSVADM